MRKVCLLFVGLGGVTAAAAEPFARFPDGAGRPQPYTKAAPAYRGDGPAWPYAAGRLSATAVIDPSKSAGRVTPYHFGNNIGWWAGRDWTLAPDRLKKARAAGFRFWRFPGGSASDEYHWDGDYGRHPGRAGDMFKDFALKSDGFIRLCRSTGAAPIVTVNFGLARYGSLDEACDLAARWVTYFNKTRRFKVRHWEIGNEVFAEWEAGYRAKGKVLTGDEYARGFRKIAAAMKKADPDIFIGACAVAEDSEGTPRSGGFNYWMRKMLPELRGSADFLSVHEYFTWPFDFRTGEYVKPTPRQLLTQAKRVSKIRTACDAMVRKYAGSRPLPVALTEFNVTQADAPPTVQLVNALFTAEVLGEGLKAGLAAMNYWDWKNAFTPPVAGKKFAVGGGEHGMLASGDGCPVSDATPWPSYYAYAVFERACGDTLLPCRGGDGQVRVYASRFRAGQLGLVLVNEHAEPVRLRVRLGDNGPRLGNAWAVTGGPGGRFDTRRVAWNGKPGPANGGGPFPLEDIPPYRVNAQGGVLKLTLPGPAVVGVVLHPAG